MFIYLYILFIINYLLTNQKSCGSFVLFDGYQFIPSNDKEYGEPACEGNCDSSRYSQIQKVLSNKCMEGYYNVEGFCIKCSIGSEHFVKCSYEISSENKQIYTCLECVDGLDGEYRISKDNGKCRTYKCHNNYYLSNGRYKGCHYKSNVIEGGICYNYYCPNG